MGLRFFVILIFAGFGHLWAAEPTPTPQDDQSMSPPIPPPPPPPPSPSASQEPSPQAEQQQAKKPLEGIGDGFVYSESDRRDPFVPFSLPRPNVGSEELTWLQRFEIDQLQLVGIIWDVRKPKCMFLDPNGRTHIVGRNEKIGVRGGFIAEIRENEIVIVEKVKTAGLVSFQTRVLKLVK